MVQNKGQRTIKLEQKTATPVLNTTLTTQLIYFNETEWNPKCNKTADITRGLGLLQPTKMDQVASLSPQGN
jgi:hypothetical protein